MGVVVATVSNETGERAWCRVGELPRPALPVVTAYQRHDIEGGEMFALRPGVCFRVVTGTEPYGPILRTAHWLEAWLGAAETLVVSYAG